MDGINCVLLFLRILHNVFKPLEHVVMDFVVVHLDFFQFIVHFFGNCLSLLSDLLLDIFLE